MTHADPYSEYAALVDAEIDTTRSMPHCDQFVLHSPERNCEYCNRSPLQAARVRLGINFTGERNPKLLLCPAEIDRSLANIERWSGNVAMTPEMKRARKEYWANFDQQLREKFPEVNFDD